MRNNWTDTCRQGIVALFASAAIVGSGGIATAQSTRWEPLSEIPSGTTVAVRTTEPITANSSDGQVFTGVIENDVADRDGRIAITQGSRAELMVRRGANNELVLDLDSIMINGRRYAIDAGANAVGTSGTSSLGINKKTGEYVGGGALLGTIIGGVTGGAKGAAIGAVIGAAAGAGVQVATHGTTVNVPAETVLTYRLDRPLALDIDDTGYTQNGHHYHRIPR